MINLVLYFNILSTFYMLTFSYSVFRFLLIYFYLPKRRTLHKLLVFSFIEFNGDQQKMREFYLARKDFFTEPSITCLMVDVDLKDFVTYRQLGFRKEAKRQGINPKKAICLLKTKPRKKR